MNATQQPAPKLGSSRVVSHSVSSQVGNHVPTRAMKLCGGPYLCQAGVSQKKGETPHWPKQSKKVRSTWSGTKIVPRESPSRFRKIIKIKKEIGGNRATMMYANEAGPSVSHYP